MSCVYLIALTGNIDEEKSQKDRILTASKTIWMLTSWHKILVPALGSYLAEYGRVTTEAQPTIRSPIQVLTCAYVA